MIYARFVDWFTDIQVKLRMLLILHERLIGWFEPISTKALAQIVVYLKDTGKCAKHETTQSINKVR